MFFRKKKGETRVIVKIQPKIEVSPCGQTCTARTQAEAPPPYRAEPEEPEGASSTRNTECEVRLQSEDANLADIIAEKSGGPTAAIAKAIYAAAYATKSEDLADTVNKVSRCIQVAIEAVDDLPQADKDKAAPAIMVSTTNALKMATAVGPRHIVGGMNSEEAAAAVRVAEAFDMVDPKTKKAVASHLRGIIICSISSLFEIPETHAVTVNTAFTNAISSSIKAIMESPVEAQHALAMTFISFAAELADCENDGRSFALPSSI